MSQDNPNGGRGVNILCDGLPGGQTFAVDVTGTPTALKFLKLQSGVVLKAPASNVADVFFGFRDDITPGTVDDTDGFILAPGESQPVSADNAARLYHVTGTPTQKLFVLAQ